MKKDLEYTILADSSKGIMMIEHKSIIGCCFYIDNKYTNTHKILESFIKKHTYEIFENVYINEEKRKRGEIDNEKKNEIMKNLLKLDYISDINTNEKEKEKKDGEKIVIKIPKIFEKSSVTKIKESTNFKKEIISKRVNNYCGFHISNSVANYNLNNSVNIKNVIDKRLEGIHEFEKNKDINKDKTNLYLNKNLKDKVEFSTNNVNKDENKDQTFLKSSENFHFSKISEDTRAFTKNEAKSIYDTRTIDLSSTAVTDIKTVHDLNKNNNSENYDEKLKRLEIKDMSDDDLVKYYLNERRNLTKTIMDDMKRIINYKASNTEFHEQKENTYDNRIRKKISIQSKLSKKIDKDEYRYINTDVIAKKLITSIKKDCLNKDLNKVNDIINETEKAFQLYSKYNNHKFNELTKKRPVSTILKNIKSDNENNKESQKDEWEYDDILTNQDYRRSIFHSLYPYLDYDLVPKEKEPFIPIKSVEKYHKQREVIRLNLSKKQFYNNYDKNFKKYEKDLDSYGDTNYVKSEGEYITKTEQDRREDNEKRKKWVCKKDFCRIFPTKKYEILSSGNSDPLSIPINQHKFREEDKSKWIANGFKFKY